MQRRRTKVIKVHLNEEEWTKIKNSAEATGMRLAPYLRAAGLGQRLKSRAYEELAREILAIGHIIMTPAYDPKDQAKFLESELRPILSRIRNHIS